MKNLTKNCKQDWKVDLDELTNEEYDSFIEHAFSCKFHAKILDVYENSMQPVIFAALTYKEGLVSEHVPLLESKTATDGNFVSKSNQSSLPFRMPPRDADSQSDRKSIYKDVFNSLETIKMRSNQFRKDFSWVITFFSVLIMITLLVLSKHRTQRMVADAKATYPMTVVASQKDDSPSLLAHRDISPILSGSIDNVAKTSNNSLTAGGIEGIVDNKKSVKASPKFKESGKNKTKNPSEKLDDSNSFETNLYGQHNFSSNYYMPRIFSQSDIPEKQLFINSSFSLGQKAAFEDSSNYHPNGTQAFSFKFLIPNQEVKETSKSDEQITKLGQYRDFSVKPILGEKSDLSAVECFVTTDDKLESTVVKPNKQGLFDLDLELNKRYKIELKHPEYKTATISVELGTDGVWKTEVSMLKAKIR